MAGALVLQLDGNSSAAIADSEQRCPAGQQQRTARMEPTSGRDRAGVGYLAGEDLWFDVLGLGNNRQQRLGVGVLGRLQHLLGRPQLDDLAEVHHGDAVSDVPRHAEIVGHRHDRQPRLVDERAQQQEDLATD